MAWNGFPTCSGAGGFIGTVLTEMGEEKGTAYLRELGKQKIANLRGSAREVLDQTIAGEYSLALQIFNHHAVISAKKGAPVDWIAMEPATVTLSTLSVLAKAPHPNAAKLLMDFIISREGQEVFAKADYIPAHPDVPATRADAEAVGRKIPRAFLHAGRDRREDAEVERGVQRILPLMRRDQQDLFKT